MAKANLIIVKDPFRRHDREIKPIACDQSLLAIRETLPKDVEFIVSINGRIIPQDQLSVIYPGAGDSVVCMPEILGGGDTGKMIFRTLLMIGIAIAAPYAAAALGFVAASGALTVTGMMVAGGIAVAGGLMLNLLLPPIKPKMPTMDGFDGSQSYSWNPHTLQTQGIVVPKFYGKNKLYGNIIASHIQYDNEKQYLYALIDLGIGPIKELTDFKIQDQKEESYNHLKIDIRKGYLNQQVIKEFTNTKVDYAVENTRLKHNKEKEYTTTGSSFNRLIITIGFPQGLAKYSDDGSKKETSVNIKIRIKKQGDADWTIITRQASATSEITVATAYWSLGRKVPIKEGGGKNAWEEYQAGSSVRADHAEGDEVDDSYDTYQWKWFKKNKIYTKATSFSNYKTFREAYAKAIYRNIYAEIPDAKIGIHTIEATRLTANNDDNNNNFADASYLTQVTEVIDHKFIYPRNVLVGIKALATDQLSGSMKFSCLGRCALVNVYTGTYPNGTWSVQYSSNLAWAAWDILTQPVLDNDLNIIRYDGMATSRLDLAKWKEWADFCNDWVYDGKTIQYTTSGSTLITIKLQDGGADFDADEDGDYPYIMIDPTGGTNYETVQITAVTDNNTLTVTPNLSSAPGSGVAVKKAQRRISFNGGFDQDSTVWDAVLKVCQVGRAIPIWNGIDLTLAIDKPAEPVQMITVGNTELDSFEETFMSLDERASEIEVDFVDREKDFDRNKITVYNTSITDKTNPVSIELFGITRESEAWRAGMLRLYKNQHIKRFTKVELDIDAIAFTVGDVINAQCDVPQWGEGGRIVSATSTSVTLDKSVIIAASKSYNIMIRLSNDTVVEKSVTNTPGTYTVLTVSAFSQTPAQYDIYAFGEVTKVVKPFRVANIERSQEQKCTLELAEYNGSVYNADTDDPAINTANFSSLEAVPQVTNLTLEEISYIDHSGATRFGIQVDYDLPQANAISEIQIYFTEFGAQGETKPQQSSSKDDIIYDVKPYTTYKVWVVSKNLFGQQTPILNAPSATITTGTVPASNNTQLNAGIKGLQLFGQANDNTFAGRDCKVVWDHVQPVDTKTTANDEQNGAGSGSPTPWFKDYKIEIWDTAATAKLPRRTEFQPLNEYTYSYEKNYEDGLARNFEIWLWARDRFNRISETAAKIIVSNPAPAMLDSSLAYITPVLRKIKGGHRISWTHPYQRSELLNKNIPIYDLTHFLLYCDTTANFNSANLKIFTIASLVNGFDPNLNTANIDYKTEVDGLNTDNTTYYYKLVGCDAFGEGSRSNIVSGLAGKTHDDDKVDSAGPAKITGLALTAVNKINTDGKNVTNIKAVWTKLTETNIDGHALEYRLSEDITSAVLPTPDEVEEGVDGSGNFVDGDMKEIQKDGEVSNRNWAVLKAVTHNMTYFVRVQGINTGGQRGTWSDWATIVITKAAGNTDTTAPGTPTLSLSAKTESIELTASLASPPADLAGFRFAVKSTSDFAGDETSYIHAAIDSTDGKAKVTFFGTAGTTYYVKAQSYDNSKNYSSWSASQSSSPASATVSELSKAYSLWKYKGGVSSSANNKVSWTGGSGNELVKKRNSGTEKSYTVTAQTNQTVTGTMYIVVDALNDGASTATFKLVDATGLAAESDPVVIARVQQTSASKCNILRYLNDDKYSVSAYQGGFNNLSALFLDASEATLGTLNMKHDSGTSINMEDSAGNVAIRLQVNSSSDPDLVIMKSGEDADGNGGADALDPSKVAFSSKLTINGSPVRPTQPMVIESFNSQINSTTEFPAVSSGGGYNANSSTAQYKYLTSVSGTAKRKISGDLSFVGGYTIPLPFVNIVQVNANGLVAEVVDIVHDPSNADTSKRIFVRRTLVNDSNTTYSWPSRAEYVAVRLEAETFT